MDQLNSTGFLTLEISDTQVKLEKDDLLIEMAQTEGYVSDSYNGVTVVMDTNLSPELIEEGFVRELISKIQTMRKEAGFEVMDKINIFSQGNDKIANLFSNNCAQIKDDVLAESIQLDRMSGFSKEWNINGETVTLGVEKL